MSFMKKLVRNEAARNDPPQIYNGRALATSLIACGGALLFGMDMGVIGGVLVMPTFEEEYDLLGKSDTEKANLSSNIVSVLQAGAFLGALTAMWLANRVGRRWSLIIASILIFIGVAMQAGASGIIGLMYAGRFVAGVSVGIASTVNPLYVSENAPRGIRGLLTGLYQLTLVTGLTLAFWINYACTLTLAGKKQFIVPLALQALPGVILFVGMLMVDDSPRFLAQKDPQKALRVLSRLRGLPPDHPYIQQEMGNMERVLEDERQLMGSSSGFAMIKEAFAVKSYRRRSILCVTLMLWSNLTGTNSMTYYSPQIFVRTILLLLQILIFMFLNASVGLSGPSIGLFATGIYGIVKMIACAIFIVFVSDSLGRRKSLLWTAIVQGLALYYVGFYIRFDPPVSSAPVSALGYVALIAIYIFAAVYQFGWGPVVWTYCSEIPPARLRPLNMGMATASQWLFNFVVAKCTPLMFATLGAHGYGTYFLYGACCFTMAIYAWYFVPETKGLSLEFMDELFEQDDVRKKFVPSRDVGHVTGNAHELSDSADDNKKSKSIEHVENV